MKKVIYILTFIIISSIALAGVPTSSTINAWLYNGSSEFLNGNHTIDINIYNTYSGGTSLYAKTEIINVTNGSMTMTLDNLNLDYKEQYYIGINVSGDGEMTPRVNWTSEGYAIVSNYSYNSNNTDYFNGSLASDYVTKNWLPNLGYYFHKDNITDLGFFESDELGLYLNDSQIYDLIAKNYTAANTYTDTHILTNVSGFLTNNTDVKLDYLRLTNLNVTGTGNMLDLGCGNITGATSNLCTLIDTTGTFTNNTDIQVDNLNVTKINTSEIYINNSDISVFFTTKTFIYNLGYYFSKENLTKLGLIENTSDATLGHLGLTTLNVTGKMWSDDWGNVSITESQISDLTHTTDTFGIKNHTTAYLGVINGSLGCGNISGGTNSDYCVDDTNSSSDITTAVSNNWANLDTDSTDDVAQNTYVQLASTNVTGTLNVTGDISASGIYATEFYDDLININTLYVQASDWTSIDNYPTGCTNQFVRTIADTLTCASVDSADIATGAIDDDEMDYAQVTLTDFTNDANYVKNGTDADLSLINGTADSLIIGCGNITGATSNLCTLTNTDTDTTYTADEGNITLDGTVFKLLKIDLAEMDNTLNWITTTVSTLTNYFTKTETDKHYWNESSDIDDDEINDDKIDFDTVCASGNHYYSDGHDLLCEADDDTPDDDSEVPNDITIETTKPLNTTKDFTVNNNFNVSAVDGNAYIGGNLTIGGVKMSFNGSCYIINGTISSFAIC